MDQNKEIHGWFWVLGGEVDVSARQRRDMTNDEYFRISFKRYSTEAIVWLSNANN